MSIQTVSNQIASLDREIHTIESVWSALLVIAIITLVTVGYETLKAAIANPIKAIRHEG